jgi:GNAT superfamily N-acetyltransferase
MIKYYNLRENDIPTITEEFAKLGWDKPASLYERYLDEHIQGKRCVWIAWEDNKFLGYVTLLWQSRYEPFIMQNIPEIVDLNVLPEFRNRGVGSKLLELAEEKAKEKSGSVGLGVGLYEDYGPAQKLYIKRGYTPDGRGISYNFKTLDYGDIVKNDDELILWLLKKFF